MLITADDIKNGKRPNEGDELTYEAVQLLNTYTPLVVAKDCADNIRFFSGQIPYSFVGEIIKVPEYLADGWGRLIKFADITIEKISKWYEYAPLVDAHARADINYSVNTTISVDTIYDANVSIDNGVTVTLDNCTATFTAASPTLSGAGTFKFKGDSTFAKLEATNTNDVVVSTLVDMDSYAQNIRLSEVTFSNAITTGTNNAAVITQYGAVTGSSTLTVAASDTWAVSTFALTTSAATAVAGTMSFGSGGTHTLAADADLSITGTYGSATDYNLNQGGDLTFAGTTFTTPNDATGWQVTGGTTNNITLASGTFTATGNTCNIVAATCAISNSTANNFNNISTATSGTVTQGSAIVAGGTLTVGASTTWDCGDATTKLALTATTGCVVNGTFDAHATTTDAACSFGYLKISATGSVDATNDVTTISGRSPSNYGLEVNSSGVFTENMGTTHFSYSSYCVIDMGGTGVGHRLYNMTYLGSARIVRGNDLYVGNNISASGGNLDTDQSKNLTVIGDVSISGTGNFNMSAFFANISAKSITIGAGASVSGATSTTTITGESAPGYSIQNDSAGVFTANGGTVTFSSGLDSLLDMGGDSLYNVTTATTDTKVTQANAVTAAGTLTVGASTTWNTLNVSSWGLTVTGLSSNSGTLSLNASTVICTGGITNTGTLNSTSAILTSGNILNSGTINCATNGSFHGSGGSLYSLVNFTNTGTFVPAANVKMRYYDFKSELTTKETKNYPNVRIYDSHFTCAPPTHYNVIGCTASVNKPSMERIPAVIAPIHNVIAWR